MISRISSGSSRADIAVEPYEIAEHHRQLTALGGVLRLRLGLGSWPTLDRLTSSAFQCRDCFDQPPAVPQEDAQLFEIGFCQLE